MKSRMNAAQVLGDCSERDPPVPIPNTEVKPLSPDGTARASVWESRTLPRLNRAPAERLGLLFSRGSLSPQTITVSIGQIPAAGLCNSYGPEIRIWRNFLQY